MADTQKKEPEIVQLKDGEVVVDQSTLQSLLEGQAKTEKALEDMRAKNAGLEELFAKGASTTGDEKGPKLRERKNFEPAFRTVTLKKFPIKGDFENQGIVIGWTNRGAYQKVNREGVTPVVVDYIDVIFLGHERSTDGVLQAESVPLLSLLGASEVTCKVLEMKDYEGKPFRLSYPPTGQGEQKMPTGETLQVSSWDPKHGLTQTGEEIDGWVGYTNLTYIIQIPGVADPVEVDGKFLNA